MIIRRITIKDFGKIHNRTLEFSPGLNVLRGENESGKTTVHTFIRSMLYGIQRQRGRAAKKDTFAVYRPWENPASFGGILWFENGGKNYRLTRSFSREQSSGELLCEDTGEILDMEQGKLDEVLGGISEAVFENTVSVAQLKTAAGADLAREVQNYMASYQGTGDHSVDLGRTMQRLKMSRKGYQVQAERERKEFRQEKDKLTSTMDYVRREIQELDGHKDQILEQEEALYAAAGGEGGEILENRIRKLQKDKTVQAVCMAVTLAAAIGAAAELWNMGGKSLLPPVLAIAAGILLLFAEGFARMKTLRELEKRRKQVLRLKKRQEKLDWNRESLDESMKEKKTALANLTAEYEEAVNREAIPIPAETEIEAVNLAMETINELSGQIHGKVGGRLRARTSEILSEITDGKYREVLLGPDLKISINTGERTVPMESLSRGTVEQIYFSLRMAAGELLCGNEQYPIFLDEVFGMYDQERLARALQWLADQNRQVIITSCQSRETELLDKMGTEYHRIQLDE